MLVLFVDNSKTVRWSNSRVFGVARYQNDDQPCVYLVSQRSTVHIICTFVWKQRNLRWHICHEKLTISKNDWPKEKEKTEPYTKLKTTETCLPYRNSWIKTHMEKNTTFLHSLTINLIHSRMTTQWNRACLHITIHNRADLWRNLNNPIQNFNWITWYSKDIINYIKYLVSTAERNDTRSDMSCWAEKTNNKSNVFIKTPFVYWYCNCVDLIFSDRWSMRLQITILFYLPCELKFQIYISPGWPITTQTNKNDEKHLKKKQTFDA